MIKIQIDIKGAEEALSQLGDIDKAFGSWKPELKQMGDYLKNFYSNELYESEGAVWGSRWAQLSEPYKFNKRILYPGRGILQRTGDMRRGYDYEATNDRVTLWNTQEYAKYHQFGTKKMPKREIIGIDRKRREEVVKIFKQGIVNKLGDIL